MTDLFELLLTCGNYYSSCGDKMVFTSKRVHVAAWYWLVYCRLDISTSVSESASGGSTDDKQDSNCPIEPCNESCWQQQCFYTLWRVTWLRSNIPCIILFMACTGEAVISLTSYLYTVWTWVSYQVVSPTNGLGTRLGLGLYTCRSGLLNGQQASCRLFWHGRASSCEPPCISYIFVWSLDYMYILTVAVSNTKPLHLWSLRGERRRKIMRDRI